MSRRNTNLGAAIAAAVLSFLTAVGRAEDSNRNDVRANLEKDGWRVIWGKNFTEGDWARGTAAIAESVAAENPTAFLAWFDQALDQNFTKIEHNLKDVTRKDLERWIIQSLKEKKAIKYRGLRIEAGFATYNRWQRVVYDEPRTRETWIKVGPLKTKGFEPYMERVEKKVALPNWHQFYLRYQLAEDRFVGPARDGGDRDQGPGSYQIALRNNTGRPLQVSVRYQASSGKWDTRSYHLANGANFEIDVQTRNRVIYFRAEGHNYLADGGARGDHAGRGKYSKTEMGPTIGRWTHTFNP